MTAADRLRAAADMADNYGVVFYGANGAVIIDREFAALLRAVADSNPVFGAVPTCGWCRHRPDAHATDCVMGRAEALADAVLGPTSVGDNGPNSNTDDEACGGCEHHPRYHGSTGCVRCRCPEYVP